MGFISATFADSFSEMPAGSDGACASAVDPKHKKTNPTKHAKNLLRNRIIFDAPGKCKRKMSPEYSRYFERLQRFALGIRVIFQSVDKFP
jgi:hypothetical protein